MHGHLNVKIWVDNIKIDLLELGWGEAWFGLIRHRIGTGVYKADRQLCGHTVPAGTLDTVA